MLRRPCIVLLAVLFSSFCFCTDAAIATASGGVILNGKSLTRSSAVFPGDMLATASGSALVLQAKNYSIQAGPKTILSIREHSLSLTSGALHASGMAIITATNITVIGESAQAKFVIANTSDALHLTVQQGAVLVRESSGETQVRAGQSRTFEHVSQSHKGSSLVLASIGGAATGIGGLVASHLEDSPPRCISNCGVMRFR